MPAHRIAISLSGKQADAKPVKRHANASDSPMALRASALMHWAETRETHMSATVFVNGKQVTFQHRELEDYGIDPESVGVRVKKEEDDMATKKKGKKPKARKAAKPKAKKAKKAKAEKTAVGADRSQKNAPSYAAFLMHTTKMDDDAVRAAVCKKFPKTPPKWREGTTLPYKEVRRDLGGPRFTWLKDYKKA